MPRPRAPACSSGSVPHGPSAVGSSAGGHPVAGVQVSAEGAVDQAVSELGVPNGGDGVTGPDGTFTFRVPADGIYTVRTVGDAATAVVAPDADDPQVELVTTASVVSGRVVDGAGDPVPDAPVHLLIGGDDVSLAITRSRRVLFVLGGRWPGRVRLGGPRSGGPRSRGRDGALVGFRGGPDLGGESGSLAVHVTSSQDVSGAIVSATPTISSGTTEVPVSLLVPVDPDGTVTLQGLQAAGYRIEVNGPGLAPPGPTSRCLQGRPGRPGRRGEHVVRHDDPRGGHRRPHPDRRGDPRGG